MFPSCSLLHLQVTDAKVQLPKFKLGFKEAGIELTAEDTLKMVAKLGFARTLGACWIIPVVDLYVRVKLNIIGEPPAPYLLPPPN